MTGPNPIAEAVERDFRWVERDFRWLERHAAPQTPAAAPATMAVAPAAATSKESTMALSTIEDDVKADLTQGLDWLDGFVGRVKAAAPGIIATSEAVGGSTVGALVEAVAGRVLPAQLEPVLAGIVKDFVDKYGQPQPQAPAAAAPAQQPVPA